MIDSNKVLVGILMGSQSDWPIMQHAANMLSEFNIPFEARVISAHRCLDALLPYIESLENRGVQVIIAGAGGAAHLPGVIAAKTLKPVLGVPMPSAAFNGMDSLLSIVQMPAGIPVGTLAVGKPGAINAALLAASILAGQHPQYAQALKEYRSKQSKKLLENQIPVS